MATKERHAAQGEPHLPRAEPHVPQAEPHAPQAEPPAQAGRARGPVWRTLLEAQWRDRVQEVTELSLAYHEAASAAAAGRGWRGTGRGARRAEGTQAAAPDG
jgi:hypothetical protein